MSAVIRQRTFLSKIKGFLEILDIFHRKFIDFTIGGHYNCNNDIIDN